MAVNITLTGNVYDYAGIQFPGAEVRYQAYFYKNNASSSPSAWGASLNVILGQYNLNIADIIGTDGFANDGDVVVVVFWKPNTASRMSDCGSLEEWSIFRVVLGTGPGMISSEVYVNDVQTKQNICPNLSWSLPVAANVGQNVTAVNSSTDTHQWPFLGPTTSGTVTMWQRNFYYATLQTVNAVNNTDYDWDDGNQDLNLPGPADKNHSWYSPGNYTVEIVIEDECGCTVTGTKPIQISNNEPTCVVTRCQSDGTIIAGTDIYMPDTPIYFRYNGYDPDNTISGIDWIIEDQTNTISGTKSSGIVFHVNGEGTDWCTNSGTIGAFTNPDDHKVYYTLNWWNGFGIETKNCEETFTQYKFTDLYVDFEQQADATITGSVSFDNTTTTGVGLAPPCERYRWTEYEDGVVDSTISGVNHDYVFTVSPQSYDHKVELCAYWSDGWKEWEDCKTKKTAFGTKVTVTPEECYYNLHIVGTSDDGSVTGYHWEVEKYTTYSGIGPPTGATKLLWESPQGMDQQDKKVCFTSVGWYKLEGFVHGTGATTDDYENLFVDEVCVSGTGDVIYKVVPICDPDMDAHEHGLRHLRGKETKPKFDVDVEDLKPDVDSKIDDLKPDIKGGDIGAPKFRAFPPPRNL